MHVADTCITFNHVFDSQGEHDILNSPHPPGTQWNYCKISITHRLSWIIAFLHAVDCYIILCNPEWKLFG